MSSSPWAFHAHPGAWAAAVVAGVLYGVLTRRPPYRPSRGELLCFLGALLCALAVLTWPVADVALRWSLTALVLQRMTLLLAVSSLLLLGIPRPLLARVTRPAAVDTALATLNRPAVAVAVVTAVSIGTLTTGAVELQASDAWARALFDLLLVVTGLVLWSPVLARFPSTDRLSALGQVAYLIVQSIVPSFLAIVWIFAKHPLYPAFARTLPDIGLHPLTDQLIAGFLAKFGTIFVLWGVAFVIINRAGLGEEDRPGPEPLTWVDVQRQLERVDRAERRSR